MIEQKGCQLGANNRRATVTRSAGVSYTDWGGDDADQAQRVSAWGEGGWQSEIARPPQQGWPDPVSHQSAQGDKK